MTTSWGNWPDHRRSGHFHHLPTTHSDPAALSPELGLDETDHFFGEWVLKLEKWSV
jgi:hypothetical protein